MNAAWSYGDESTRPTKLAREFASQSRGIQQIVGFSGWPAQAAFFIELYFRAAFSKLGAAFFRSATVMAG